MADRTMVGTQRQREDADFDPAPISLTCSSGRLWGAKHANIFCPHFLMTGNSFKSQGGSCRGSYTPGD